MIGGFIPCSFIDYPGELAAVIFTQGCNLRCRYCHNPELCGKRGDTHFTSEDVRRFLLSRRGKLSAVVVTGGEPTLHRDIADLLSMARSIGFAVKLDTNGTLPERVHDLVSGGLVDYAAVDVKAAPGTSSQWLTGTENQGDRALETLGQLVSNGISCEARTTVIAGRHNAAHLEHISRCLVSAGVKRWRLQPVENTKALDSSERFALPAPGVLARAVANATVLGLDAAVRAKETGATTGISSEQKRR